MQGPKMKKRQVKIQSEVNMGLHSEASALLQKHVLGHLNDDPVGALIIKDPVLIRLGNSLVKLARNPLKRGKYTSEKLHICARVLQELTSKDGNAGLSWSDFIVSSSYHVVVDAVLKVCGGSDDAIDKPTNALKLGHRLKDLADIKITRALLEKNEEEAKDCRIFKELIDKNWKADVSSLALATLAERKFNKPVELPLPDDLEMLSRHLQSEAKKIKTIQSVAEYQNVVQIVESRLLTYNKRCPGELEGIR